MIVTLDGRKVEARRSGGDTLQDVLDEILAAHLGERLIISVSVNGETLDEEDLQTDLEQPLPSDVQIDLESSDAAGMVVATLRSLARELDAAGARLADTATRLASGEAAAISDVGALVRLWQTAYRALARCGAVLHRDLAEFDHAGQPVGDELETMVQKLAQVRDALEAGDLVLQADLVRHELPGLIKAWQTLLAHLADRLAAEHVNLTGSG